MLAVAILRPTNTRRSTMPLPIIRLSQVSSPVSAGFTTTVPVNLCRSNASPSSLASARSAHARTSRTSTCKLANDPRIGSPLSAYSAASRLWISATTAAPSPTAAATRFVGLHSLGECTRPIHDTSQDGFDYDRRGRRNYHFLLHRSASLRTHVPIPPRSVDLGLALEAKERVAIGR